nr:hypothetical protein [Halomonas sp. 1513]
MLKIKMFVAGLGLVLLAGCTITGEPRIDRVAFDSEGYVVKTERFRDSITVGEITDFPGTSTFTYGGRIAPNFSNETFEEVLQESLSNANLSGNNYTLNARLVDSGDWSDWGFVWGTDTRRTEIEYALLEGETVVFQEVIVSDVEMEISKIKPFYLMQRDVAEVNYAKNIELLIEKINDM